MNNSEKLGSERIGKLFLSLAIPAVIAQIINLLYNIIDRIYIGHIADVGSVALTGVGVCLPLIIFITAFSSLCGMGGAPKAAIYLGEGKKEEANKVLGNCFTLTLILGVILTLIFQIYGDKLLLAFGASDDTFPYASKYFRIYTLGSLFVMISMGLSMFITTQGFSKISMKYTIIGAICNIILDPIFIFLFKFGVAGAAIATIISQALTSFLVIRFLINKKTILKINYKNMKLDYKIILPCVALGISPFIMMSTESIISICFNTSLQKYGGDLAVGTMTILSSLMQFAMFPLQGFAQGAQPIISYNFGAKKFDRCKKAFKILLVTSIGYSVLYWILIMLIPKVFIQMFTTDLTLIEYGVWAIRIYLAVNLIFGIQIACQQTFIALGNAKISLFLALLRKVILLIPLIYIIPLFVKDKCFGVFLAEPISDFIAVCTTTIMFITYYKKAFNNKNIKLKEVG